MGFTGGVEIGDLNVYEYANREKMCFPGSGDVQRGLGLCMHLVFPSTGGAYGRPRVRVRAI